MEVISFFLFAEHHCFPLAFTEEEFYGIGSIRIILLPISIISPLMLLLQLFIYGLQRVSIIYAIIFKLIEQQYFRLKNICAFGSWAFDDKEGAHGLHKRKVNYHSKKFSELLSFWKPFLVYNIGRLTMVSSTSKWTTISEGVREI